MTGIGAHAAAKVGAGRRAGIGVRYGVRLRKPRIRAARRLGYLDGQPPAGREVSISENWGFALFETDRYKLVVDEDAVVACHLVDLESDPNEDINLARDPRAASVVDDLMEAYVRPFLSIAPARPHKSPFTHPG